MATVHERQIGCARCEIMCWGMLQILEHEGDEEGDDSCANKL